MLLSSSELSAHYLQIGNASFSANGKDANVTHKNMVADLAILSKCLTTELHISKLSYEILNP